MTKDLAKLINDYALARIDVAFMGKKPEDEWYNIHMKLSRARMALELALFEATNQVIKLE